MAENIAWSPERLDKLRELAADPAGFSAEKMASRIGGTTRNAVIGQIARHHIYWTRQGRPGGVGRRRAKHTLNVEGEPIDRGVARVSFADIDAHQCRYIPGDPLTTTAGKPLFCGETKATGLPYCEHHAKLCFEPATAKNVRRREYMASRHSGPVTSISTMKAVEEFSEA